MSADYSCSLCLGDYRSLEHQQHTRTSETLRRDPIMQVVAAGQTHTYHTTCIRLIQLAGAFGLESTLDPGRFSCIVPGCDFSLPSRPTIEAMIEAGEVEGIRELLSQGEAVGIFMSQQYRGRMVVMAAEHGHEAVVQLLLNFGGDVRNSISSHQRWTALSSAVKKGHADVVSFLLSAEPAIPREDLVELLVLAVSYGHEPIVRLLLAIDDPAFAKGLSGAFYVAAVEGRAEIAILLLRYNSRAISDSKAILAQAFKNAAVHGHQAVVELLLEAYPGFFDAQLLLVLSAAVQNGHAGTVSSILKVVGSKVSPEDLEKFVQVAAEAGHEDVFRLLLPQVNIVAAFLIAVRWGQPSIVNIVFQCGGGAQISEEVRISALIGAIDNNNPKIAHTLVEHTPNLSSVNRGKAVIQAAASGYEDVVRALQRATNATISLEARDRAIERARDRGHETIVGILEAFPLAS